MKQLLNEFVIDIACADLETLIRTVEGKVYKYAVPSLSNEPILVPSLKEKIVIGFSVGRERYGLALVAETKRYNEATLKMTEEKFSNFRIAMKFGIQTSS